MAIESNTITFGTSRMNYSGINAVKHLEELWDMELTLPPLYWELDAKVEKLNSMYAALPTPNLTSFVLETPVDKWDKQLAKAMENEAEHNFLRTGYDSTIRELTNRMSKVVDSPALYDHIVSQLDLDTAEEEFTAAAEAIGDIAHDLEACIERDHEATDSFRRWGRRLQSIAFLLPTGNGRGGSRNDFAAVWANMTPLPRLEHHHTTNDGQRYGSESRTYDDEDWARHDIAYGAIGEAAHPGTFLTKLARRHWQDFTLRIARDFDEYQQRLALMGDVAKHHHIDTETTPTKRNRKLIHKL